MLKQIVVILFLMVAFQAAGQNYVIDKVCLGAERHYRIDGEPGSVYIWQLTISGIPIPIKNSGGTGFTAIDPLTGQQKTGNEIVFTWTKPGIFNLVATQYSTLGCDTIQHGEVHVFPAPFASAGNQLIICAGNSVSLNEAEGSDYSAILWTSSGDGHFDNATLINPTYNPGSADKLTGTVFLKLTAEAKGLCNAATDSVKIIINQLLIPSVTITADNSIVCNNIPVTFRSKAQNGGSMPGFIWNVNGRDSGVRTPDFTMIPVDGDRITVTMTSNETCTSAIQTISNGITIHVQQILPPVVIAITQPVCNSETGSITLSGLPETGIWFLTRSPDGTISKGTGTSSVITGLAPGTYAYSVTNDKNCTSKPTTEIIIETVVQLTPVFKPIDAICLNSTPPLLPAVSTNGITGTWNPSIITATISGIRTYTFTPRPGQCAISLSIQITINAPVIPFFKTIGPYCQYASANALPSTSSNGIAGSWNPESINTDYTGSANYTFIPLGDECAISVKISVTITEPVNPKFENIDPICQNTTAPLLLTTSLNGITGSWNPSVIGVSIVRTNSYTFTPSPGLCASKTQIPVSILEKVRPIFENIGPLCLNSTTVLPVKSSNNITGYWEPTIINTTSEGISSYIFTPNVECAVVIRKDISTISNIIPEFLPFDTLCQNSVPPELPATSLNKIRGTWSPDAINTGVTELSNYTFTPDASCCSSPVTMEIYINNSITPIFELAETICQYSKAPVLPVISNNEIQGKWRPSTINTTLPGTSGYIFNPLNTGVCINIFKKDITIKEKLKPEFSIIGPLCENSRPPDLPVNSSNGINGSWLPARINTKGSGTDTYRFTPSESMCSYGYNAAVTTIPLISPTFARISPICQNDLAPILPLHSTNTPIINGTWNPAVINTASPGITVCTFNPDSGTCASRTTMNIEILSQSIPQFELPDTVCQNSSGLELPTGSLNLPSITGTWNPSVISTSTIAMSSYLFTPTAGLCASPIQLITTVIGPVVPLFTQIGPLIQNSVAPELPAISTNNITGTWNPPLIDATTAKIGRYTFTPDNSECATQYTMDISIAIRAVIASEKIIPGIPGILSGACGQISLNGWQSSGENLTYNWSLSGSCGFLSATYGASTNFSFLTDTCGLVPEDILIRLMITDCNGNTDNDSLTVHVDPFPSAVVSSSGEIEKDGSLIIDGILSIGTEISYKWTTNEGRIIGPDSESSVKILGAGMYRLTITDIYKCQNTKDYFVPFEIYTVKANPDHYRITWVQDTVFNVLENDFSSVAWSNIQVIKNPVRGRTKINTDNSITYSPQIKKPGYDEFEYLICNIGGGRDSTKVSIEILDSYLFIPEGISPNGDGINDVLEFKGLEKYEGSTLIIYSRSGVPVFRSSGNNYIWDGKITRGTLKTLERVPSGTYYYVLKLGQTNRILKGFIYVGYSDP